MQAPEKIEPRSLADYLEVMSKSVFQTGISWKVVETKWPGIRDAMREFDPEALSELTPTDLDELTQDTRVIRNRRGDQVAGYPRRYGEFDPEALSELTPTDLDELTQDTRVIRNRRKLEAIVSNATRMLELEEQHDSFRGYLRSHDGFEGTAADLRKQFRFLGDMGAFHFLYVVGEEVPSYEDWCASRGRTPRS